MENHEKELLKMKIRNPYAHIIYQYIYRNDGQTILQIDIAEETGISRPTIRKYLKWLERRNLIKKTGKRISILLE